MTQKTEVVTIRMEYDLLNALQTIAEREGVSMAYITRRAIRKGLNLPMPSKEAEPIKMPESWE